MLQHGLYEQVVNVALKEALEDIPEARKALAPIDAAEASKVLSQYMTDIIKQGFDNVVDNGGDIASQVALANKIVDVIVQTTAQADFAENGIDGTTAGKRPLASDRKECRTFTTSGNICGAKLFIHRCHSRATNGNGAEKRNCISGSY